MLLQEDEDSNEEDFKSVCLKLQVCEWQSKHIKFRRPRPRTDKETTHTLSHWKVIFTSDSSARRMMPINTSSELT